MGFLSAAFLLGLAAIAAPIAIHLIHRQRYPERPFTTLRFFDTTVKHNVIQRRLIDRVLLALRIAALAALALGLARPFAGAGLGGLGEQRLSLVIVLDNSPSMGRERDGVTLFARAQEAAGALAAKLQDGDRAELVLSAGAGGPRFTADRGELLGALGRHAGAPTALLVDGPEAAKRSLTAMTSDHARIRQALMDLPDGTRAALVGWDDADQPRLGYGRERLVRAIADATVAATPGDARAALAVAARLLAGSRDGDRQVVVYSDLQRGEWDAGADAPAMPDLDGVGLSLVAIEPGAGGVNIAVTGVELDERDASLGSVVGGTALIANRGDADSGPVTLTVGAGDGRETEVALESIPAGAAVRAAFPLRVMGRGRDLTCTAVAACARDAFAYDDRWHFQVGMRPPITALCLSGQGGSGAARSSFYLVNALSPRAGSNQVQTLAEPIERELAALTDEAVFKYAVIAVVGATALDAAQREKLRHFAADGGGVMVFPPAGAAPEEYNGWGFLPARVSSAQTTFTHIAALAAREPAVAELKARGAGAATGLSCDAWLKLEPAADATVLAWFADGSPALVEGRVGRGRVILAAAGAHLRDSDWPLRPAFPLLVRNLVKALGAPDVDPPLVAEHPVGGGAAALIPAELRGSASGSFRVGDGGGFIPTAFLRAGDALVLPPTRAPGHYLLAARPGAAAVALAEPGLGAAVLPVSVNHGASESDLAALGVERVAELMPSATTLAIDADPAATLAALRRHGELWRWLLVVALVVLVVESVIAWRQASTAAA
ncbi:MAG TPA: BatA domain-containing protein [Planctomycetota bacterium]|nr:BatA domain-containing protein [Planctomycetota bacterium]